MVEIEGRAVPFEQVATVDGRLVLFERGAFTGTLRNGALTAQVNHAGKGSVIASQDDGSLVVAQDDGGLMFALQVRDSDWASLLALCSQTTGLVGCSPGWDPASELGYWSGGVWVISACRLLEISVLTGTHRPAFAGTWARVRQPRAA